MDALQNTIFNLTGPGKIHFVNVNLSESVPPDYVRVAIEYCGICGTDLCFYHGYRNEGYPICLGHEHCGTVVLIGSSVTKIKKGDFVAIDPNYRCGQCKFCLINQSHLCESYNTQLYSNKGYAKYVDIHQSYLYILPPYPSRFIGALVEPLSVAINAIDIAKITDHNEIGPLVLGVGNIGTLLCFALMSYFKNLKIAIHDKNPYKTKALQDLYPNRVKIVNKISKNTERYNWVFEVTGQAAGFKKACNLLQKAGTIVIISRYYKGEPKIPNNIITWKDPIIRIAHLNGHGPSSMVQAASLLSTYWTKAHNELLSFYKFDEIDKAFSEYEVNNKNKKIIDMQCNF